MTMSSPRVGADRLEAVDRLDDPRRHDGVDQVDLVELKTGGRFPSGVVFEPHGRPTTEDWTRPKELRRRPL